ncbi:divergent polysaccharide deacetylase family protein [Paenibacillus sp. N4]|uniref:divergent polysaccharide deacetylase family protein n=1 Tax=Paenibacillus vietnamensis TaxID=2590547 RepID=UPI001CD0E2B8|nr:divergent polysaccharide deacetylase family protein [Paenibacillus vietnamensis]MCA0753698.1 divergent polysaccharide deacetylase family protein [Paenibacillus vietnamensis]
MDDQRQKIQQQRRRGKTVRTVRLTAIAAFISVLLACTLTGTGAAAQEAGGSTAPREQRSIAIVIDDFGNGMDGTEEMLQLPVKFTAAIMPFMPTTKQDAEEAHKRGHDVIVHMPMEPNKGLKKWLGPGALTTDLSDEEVRRRVEAAIDDVPYAIGMNNHMGSKVTADERMMRIVLGVCKERGLFFLDSRTTYKTVVPKVAAELQVPIVSNDVFLDDVYSVQHISGQIEVLRKHLESHESCVTIGHVGPPGKKTASVLRQSIPVMQQNARFVKLTHMIPGLMNDPFILPNS